MIPMQWYIHGHARTKQMTTITWKRKSWLCRMLSPRRPGWLLKLRLWWDDHVYIYLFRPFSGILNEIPYRWFIDVLSSSIASFTDLILKFITQYISNVYMKKSSNILMRSHKEAIVNATIQKTLAKVMTEVPNQETNLEIHGFQIGLCHDLSFRRRGHS